MHVDGASGGFVWPFLYPDSEWDFRLEQVRSINVSGHKFGLVYPGIGWLIFREKSDLAEDLVFYENYLGKTDATFTLNFSTGASMVLAQYYNFVRFGREGYAYIMEAMEPNAKLLAEKLKATGNFELIGDGEEQLPLVAFKLAGEKSYDEFDVSWQLSAERGWMLPAYTMPPDAEDVKVLRALVKQTLSREQIDRLADDIDDRLRDAGEEGRRPRLRAQENEGQPRLLRLARLGGPPGAGGRRSRRPPGALAEPVGDRRDQQGADDEGVEQDADRHRGADLDQLLERQQGQGGEGAGEDQAGAGDDAAGVDERGQYPLAGAVGGRLLARPGHQEDVVVDPERDEEDEGEQDEVEGDPFAAELGEGERAEAERGREGEDDGGDQVERARPAPAARRPGSGRRRAGPAARSAACRGRWSARCRSSRPGCRRAGRRGRARVGARGSSSTPPAASPE